MHASKQDQDSLNILKNREDFVACAQSGKKWVSKGLILQVRDNESAEKRVGYTVTKRTEKSAVKRNRIKRRLRAVAADVLPAFAKQSCDYVLIGRSETRLRPYGVLCEDLKWCLKKLGYLEKQDNQT